MQHGKPSEWCTGSIILSGVSQFVQRGMTVASYFLKFDTCKVLSYILASADLPCFLHMSIKDLCDFIAVALECYSTQQQMDVKAEDCEQVPGQIRHYI